MTRLVLTMGVSAFLAAAPLGALADEAPPAAQGETAKPVTGGCLPGGGCCGAGAACTMPPKGDDAKAAAGGCPCQKAKQAAQQAAPPANP